MPPRKLSSDELQRLINDVRSEEPPPQVNRELLGGNEGQSRAGSSIMGDLFNLLSRPARASAGAALALTDTDPNTTAMGGILEGLSGKGTASYSDVLGNLGVKGPTKAVGGFVGDVLLDPLTYVGVKSTKGLSGSEARLRAVSELGKLGKEVTEDSVETTAAQLAKADPSKTWLSFAGKKISPEVTAPARVGNTVKDALIGEEGDRRLIAKIFSRRSELPFGLADDARVLEASNAGMYDRHQKAISSLFGRLSKSEQEEVSLAVEKGIDLSEQPVYGAARTGQFTSLEDYKQVAQKEFKRFFDEETELGLYKPEQFDPNYVYKYFKKGLPEAKPGLPAAAVARRYADDKESAELLNLLKTGDTKTVLELAGKRAKEYSLEDARKANLDPAMEIGEMLGLRAAKHYRTMGRQGFVKHAIEKFGVDINDGNRMFLIQNDWAPAAKYLQAPIAQNEQLAGKYLPKQIAQVINSTETVLKDGQIGADFMRFYDKTIGAWKSLNTAYNPGYHVRNSFSDGIINFMDGVRNPTLYSRATRTLQHAKKVEAEEILGVADPLEAAVGKVKVGRNQLTPDEMWSLYLKGGSKTGFITNDISPSLDPLVKEGIAKTIDRTKTGAKGALNTLNTGINDLGETREDWFRLAHHIKGMEDNLPKNRVATPAELEAAAMKAGERVRKYNIDYGMLSSAEKNVMRRIVPFYGWMRRNLPLQMELLFTKPGYMAMYPKGQDLMQGLMGTDNGEGDFMIPKWIRDSSPMRLAVADNEKNTALGKVIKKLAGAGDNTTVFSSLASTQTPMGDLMTVADPLAAGLEKGPTAGVKELFNTAWNTLTPAIKAPGEVASGRSAFTGAEIDNWGEWALNQVGPTRAAGKAAQGDVRFGTSWLAGLNLQPATPNFQQGEYRRREDNIDSAIRQAKLRTASERGLEPTEKLMQKIKSEEIVRLQRYKENNKRILGGITGENP